jgi:cytoskeletal protein CcmA (bactofilin family)
MDHTHGPSGEIIVQSPADIGPAAAEVEAVEVVADADVEIAKINADRDVKIEQLGVKRDEVWQEARVVELEGQLRGMREMLDKLMPEPEPEQEPAPVIVAADPGPEDDIAPAPAPDLTEEPAAPKKAKGYWGGYS